VDVLVLAATNRDLEAEVGAGRFRADLFYRLNVVEIHVPPLRVRLDDIPYLTATFVRECRERLGKPLLGVTPSAERMLMASDWPGNVRQLRNLIERASMLCEGDLISERELRIGLPQRAPVVPPTGGTAVRASAATDASLTIRATKRAHVRKVLNDLAGDREAAARMLGVSRRTLNRLLHDD
jgi:DNA-binding NtrC family response regulator